MPATQLLFDPAAFRSIEPRINDVQKRDQPLVAGLAREQPLGKLKLFAGARGEGFDRHKNSLKRFDRAFGQVDHHNGAVCAAADTVHEVTEEPAPQLVRPSRSDHQQISTLFQGAATHSAGNVFIQSQQAAGSDLELFANGRSLGQPFPGGCHGASQSPPRFFETGADQRQGQ
ncbi:MAG: Uncharacterised protein [Cyanobium sp. ARS6]|nr:MAG: Uncharacterised protein [Cyanobium sp. ARS6]